MEIIKKFDQSQISSIDKTIIQASENGKGINWKRTYFLRNPSDGHVAVVSLNFFERMIWNVQKLFGKENYYKFESVFATKTVKVISPTDLEATMQKVHSQVERVLNPTESKTDQSVETPKKEEETKEPSTDKPIEQQDETVPSNIRSSSEKFDRDTMVLFKAKQEREAKHDAALVTITAFLNRDQEVNLDQVVKAVDQLNDSEKKQNCGELAKICFKQENFDEAIAILQKQNEPENQASLCKEFALECFQKGNYEKAIAFLNTFLIGFEETDLLSKELALSCCREYKYADAVKFIYITGRPSLTKDIFTKAAKEDFDNDNLDKAVETMLYLKNVYRRTDIKDFCIQVAEKYKILGEVDKSKNLLDKVTSEHKEATTEKLLHEDESDILNVTLNAIKELPYPQRDEKYIELAKNLFKEGNYKKTIEIIDKYVDRMELKGPLCKELALSCCREYKYADVALFINASSNSVTTREIFAEVAEEEYQKDNFEKAIEVIGKVVNMEYKHHLDADNFYLKIGKKYLEDNKLDKAEEMLDKVKYTSRDEVNGFIRELVKKSLDNGDLLKAFWINKRNENSKQAKDLYVQILQAYIEKGNDTSTNTAILAIVDCKNIDMDEESMNKTYAYMDEGKYDMVITTIKNSGDEDHSP